MWLDGGRWKEGSPVTAGRGRASLETVCREASLALSFACKLAEPWRHSPDTRCEHMTGSGDTGMDRLHLSAKIPDRLKMLWEDISSEDLTVGHYSPLAIGSHLSCSLTSTSISWSIVFCSFSWSPSTPAVSSLVVWANLASASPLFVDGGLAIVNRTVGAPLPAVCLPAAWEKRLFRWPTMSAVRATSVSDAPRLCASGKVGALAIGRRELAVRCGC